MKKAFFLLFVCFLLTMGRTFSQTVYAGQSTPYFHVKNCKIMSKNSQPMTISKAAMIGKTPCKKCKPPTKEVGGAKKKAKPKPKAKTAAK